MLLTLFLTLVNLLLALLELYAIRLKSFDLAPILTIIAARHGESILLAALLINLPYAVLNPQKLRFLWATLPLTILIGYLALLIKNSLLLILLYHGLLAAIALLVGAFGGGYLLFTVVNMAANLIVARFVG